MRRQIHKFEIKCDHCGVIVVIETYNTHPSPEGWLTKRNPGDHWIVQPQDICPLCVEKEKSNG